MKEHRIETKLIKWFIEPILNNLLSIDDFGEEANIKLVTVQFGKLKNKLSAMLPNISGCTTLMGHPQWSGELRTEEKNMTELFFDERRVK